MSYGPANFIKISKCQIKKSALWPIKRRQKHDLRSIFECNFAYVVQEIAFLISRQQKLKKKSFKDILSLVF